MVKEKQITKKDFLNDLYLFYRLFIASNYPNSVPAPHIKKISRKLMDLHNGTGKHRLAVSLPPRHPIENECPVLTTNGWKKHGDLKVGDYVFSPNGKPTKIIEVHPKTMVDNCLEFNNGDKIICGDNHLWKLYDRVSRKYSLFETQQIMNRKLKQHTAKNQETNTFSIDVANPLNFPTQEVPIDPYWLGLWLGGGHHKRPSITLHKNDIITTESTPYKVIRYDEKVGNCVEAIYSHQGLTEKLRKLNVYGNKHIPKIYLYNSINVRMELLAGLIDSDGCVEKERNRIIFSNTNTELLKQVYELLIGLGFTVSVSKQTSDEQNEYKKHCKSNYNVISRKDIYHLRTYAHKSIPTRLLRKQIKNKRKQYRVGLSKAYKVESVEGNCITVDNEDGLYLVGKHLTTTHNSKSSLITLSFPLWLIFQNPNYNIMIVTGSPKLAEKFGIQLREYVRDLGKYFNVYLSQVKQASTHIMFCDRDNKLYKGSIMLASSGGGITGQDADYLILDDPYTGNDEEFTPSALQKKIDWVNRVIEQRIEPHTKYCILHTRWHPISDDCPVYTTNRGWVTHGELEVGDCVLNKKYKTTEVVRVHPKTVVDNCLVFSNGDSIVCGDGHLWYFHDNDNDESRLFTAKEVMARELYSSKSYLPTFKIPSSTKCISLIDAYKVEKQQGNCITVKASDGMYLVGENFTPTHNSQDIIGYYKESDPQSYDFIEFPAITETGEPLWKERYTIEELLKKKEVVGDRVFESVYQQQPIDMTSDFFNMPMLKYGYPTDYDINYVTKCRAWDIASSDALTKNDFTAGILMYRYEDYAIIEDLVHGRFGNNTKNIIVSTAENDTPNVKIVVETGVASAGKLLYEEWQNQLTGYMVERAEVSGGKSKVDRATPLQNAIEDGKVYVNIQDPVVRQAFYDELSSFPNGKHDDITDATAHAYNQLFMENMSKRRPRPKIGVVFL